MIDTLTENQFYSLRSRSNHFTFLIAFHIPSKQCCPFRSERNTTVPSLITNRPPERTRSAIFSNHVQPSRSILGAYAIFYHADIPPSWSNSIKSLRQRSDAWVQNQSNRVSKYAHELDYNSNIFSYYSNGYFMLRGDTLNSFVIAFPSVLNLYDRVN